MSIKKIIVLPRRIVESAIQTPQRLSENTWALISIWNSYELIHFMTRPILKQIGCQEALSVKFADLTLEERKQYPDSKLFGENDARLIIDFIDSINKLDIPELIIHCAAGISRSGAVGLWACRYLELDEKQFRENNKRILPNTHVLDVLNEISGTNKKYMDFWASKEMKEKRELMFKIVQGGLT